MEMAWISAAVIWLLAFVPAALEVHYTPSGSRVIALNKDTGAVVWSSRDLASPVVESLTVRDVLVVRAAKGLVYGLETGGGVVLWK